MTGRVECWYPIDLINWISLYIYNGLNIVHAPIEQLLGHVSAMVFRRCDHKALRLIFASVRYMNVTEVFFHTLHVILEPLDVICLGDCRNGCRHCLFLF